MVSLDRRFGGQISTAQLMNITKQIAEQILKQAKANAPVCSGALRRSGQIVKKTNGYQIQFTAPYAEEVHNGRPADPGYTETYRIRGYSVPMEFETDITVYPTNRRYNVSSYRKRITKTRKTVTNYTRTRQGKKRVRINCRAEGSKWITLDLTKPTKPQPFLADAVAAVIGQGTQQSAYKRLM